MTKSTDQESVTPPHLRNPTGKGGFGDNPQHRNPGGWKKTDTARYKLEKMIVLSPADLQAVIDDSEAPVFEQRMAVCIQNGQWKELEGMINQVYGKPKESVEHTNPDGNLIPTVKIIDERQRDTDTK